MTIQRYCPYDRDEENCPHVNGEFIKHADIVKVITELLASSQDSVEMDAYWHVLRNLGVTQFQSVKV